MVGLEGGAVRKCAPAWRTWKNAPKSRNVDLGNLMKLLGTSGAVIILLFAVVVKMLLLVGGDQSLRLVAHSRYHQSGQAVEESFLGVVQQLCPNVVEAQRFSPLALHIFSAVNQAADEFNVEHELLLAVVAAESGCRVGARSHMGATGLMQLMPETALWLGVRDLHSIGDNIRGGAKYIAYLQKKFGGDLSLTLAAYNAGPKVVELHDAVPPFRETQRYIDKVLNFYHLLRSVKEDGSELRQA